MSSTIVVKLISNNSAYPDLQTDFNSTARFVIGRNAESKIKSTRCAREQVSIYIDNDQVFIEQLGTNTSFINQVPITTNNKQILHDGDILHLLENEHDYTIRIELSKISLQVKPTLKRQNTDDDHVSLKKKKVVVNNKMEQEEERKEVLDDQTIDDSFEENRLIWIQQQLDACKRRPINHHQLQLHLQTQIKTNPTTADLWEKPCDGLEVFTSKGVTSSEKIAAFDMDGTLILTKSGKVYPIDENDWRIGFDTCFKKLKQLHADNK